MRSSVLPSWLNPGTRKGWVGAAALLWVMTVVAYLPALGGGFVFDDRMYITEDSRMDSLGGLGRIWTELQLEDLQHQYYPMTTSAFWVQHQRILERRAGSIRAAPAPGTTLRARWRCWMVHELPPGGPIA